MTYPIRRQPDFEGLVKTLFCGKSDAIPLIELGIHPSIKEAIVGRPVVTLADDIEFMRSMGYDFIKIQPSINFTLNNQVVPATASSGTYTNIPDRAWASEHNGVIASWADYEHYPWPSVHDIDYSRFEEARSQMPDGMGIIGQYGDIFTVAWEMMGFESFAIAMIEQPDLVDAIFTRVAELILSMFDTMADMDWVGALWFSDDIAYSSGLMVRPDFLRRLFFPCLKHIGDLARRRKIPFIYHTDGVLWSVMDDIIDSGVNGLHPIEPKSMDIIEVQRRYGSRLSLCGGVELDLLSRGTPDEVRELVRKYIEDLGPSGGWCAGSSNSIPDYASVENYQAMVETVLQYGAF